MPVIVNYAASSLSVIKNKNKKNIRNAGPSVACYNIHQHQCKMNKRRGEDTKREKEHKC